MKHKMKLQWNDEMKKKLLYWIPVIAVLLLLPLVTRYCYYDSRLYGQMFYPRNEQDADSQLFVKHIVFLVISAVTALVVAFEIWKNKKEIFVRKSWWKSEYGKQVKMLMPLGVYVLFALLSSLFSDYRYAAFAGSDDQFESFFVVAGYILLVSYVVFLLKKEEDILWMTRILMTCMIILATYGILQYTGNNLLNFDWFQALVTPDKGGRLESTWESNRVYLSAYNPNYAGVLLALLSAFCLGFLLTERKQKRILLEIVLLIALVTCLIGTGSRAGLLVFGVSAGLAILFMLKRLLKYWYILIPAVTLVVLSTALFVQYQDLPIWDRVKTALTPERKETNPLERLVTTQNGIDVRYNGVSFSVDMYVKDGVFSLDVYEENGKKIELISSENPGKYLLNHVGLKEVEVAVGMLDEVYPIFEILLNGRNWVFATGIEDTPGCYYLNPYNYLTSLDEVERWGFEGYEHFASSRGYLWSYTFPLLKKTIFLGSGANTFAFVFPNDNYVDQYYYRGELSLATRPHCMYLQIAVESGVISLIALLVFWGWYLVSSVPLYYRSYFKTWTERVGFACFLAVFVYLVCGLTNDSMITVAPVFWCIMGTGLAANRMVKKMQKDQAAESIVDEKQ